MTLHELAEELRRGAGWIRNAARDVWRGLRNTYRAWE